jgi:hypothetical protein
MSGQFPCYARGAKIGSGVLLAKGIAYPQAFEKIVEATVASNARGGATLPPGGNNFVALQFFVEGLTCFTMVRRVTFTVRVETAADGTSSVVEAARQSAAAAALLRHVVAATFN